jgi:DNA replication protein DnaC
MQTPPESTPSRPNRRLDPRSDPIAEWNRTRHELGRLTPEAAAERIQRHCPYCGALLIPYEYWADLYGRGLWRFRDRHGCQPETDALAAEQRDTQRRRVAAYLARLERAGLGGNLAAATFDTFTPRPDCPASVSWCTLCQTYAQGILSGKIDSHHNWLILYGDYGLGKTHLAAAILRAAIDAGRWGYFRVWPKYLERLQASWQHREAEDEHEADILAELNEGWLVVIDDLDKRHPTEFVREALFGFLNARYNAGLPTVITLNQRVLEADPQAPERFALEKFISRATLDRIIERAWKLVEFQGPSHRSGVTW